jgi:hypothetical protein
MSRKLIVIVVTALSCWGLVLDDLASANHQPPQSRRILTVSNSAMLQELRHADGRLISDIYDGFELSYIIQSQTRLASATPEAMNGLIHSSEGVTSAGNVTTAVVHTSDMALKITSQFFFKQSAKQLIIKRTFRNISTKAVTLRAVRQFVDPELIREPAFDRCGNTISLPPVHAGLSGAPDECLVFKCRVPPPLCPPYCDQSLSANTPYCRPSLKSSQTHNTLGWSNQITLMPAGDSRYILVRLSLK